MDSLRDPAGGFFPQAQTTKMIIPKRLYGKGFLHLFVVILHSQDPKFRGEVPTRLNLPDRNRGQGPTSLANPDFAVSGPEA